MRARSPTELESRESLPRQVFGPGRSERTTLSLRHYAATRARSRSSQLNVSALAAALPATRSVRTLLDRLPSGDRGLSFHQPGRGPSRASLRLRASEGLPRGGFVSFQSHAQLSASRRCLLVKA